MPNGKPTQLPCPRSTYHSRDAQTLPTAEVRRGDFAPLLRKVVAALERARDFAANEHQVRAPRQRSCTVS